MPKYAEMYRTFAGVGFSDCSSFISKVPVEKVVIDEEEVHSIEIDRWQSVHRLRVLKSKSSR